jgi:hypothetical protein
MIGGKEDEQGARMRKKSGSRELGRKKFMRNIAARMQNK